MQLHKISDNYINVQELEGVDITDTLEGIEGEFEDKADQIAKIILNLGSDLVAIKAEIERLGAYSALISNRRDSLKEYLRENMERTGIKSIKRPIFTITCAAGKDIVVIDDTDSLPNSLVFVKTIIQPDKMAILAALKTGEVEGAHIEKSKSSIRIK